MRIAAETKVIVLVAAVQMVCGLDFTMVQPLGPDLARGLGISPSLIGYVTGVYAFAAFLVGLIGVRVLDRFDRRAALKLSILGLIAATLLCAMSQGLASLMAARFLAGAFAGPVISLSYAIIADVIPPEKRGRALATVSISGSIATIIGLPSGFALAQIGGWRAPFLVIAGGGLIVAILAIRRLPRMRRHLTSEHRGDSGAAVLRRPAAIAGAVCAALASASGFTVTSNIASHVLINLHYPRDHFSRLYIVGGLVVFLVARVSGRAIDRFGSAVVMATSNLLYATMLWALFLNNAAAAPVMLLFTGNMLGNYLRTGALQTLLTKIPPPGARAGYLSFTGAMQQLGSAVGAMSSSLLLTDTGRHIDGMDRVGWMALLATVTLTPLVLLIDWMRRRDIAEAERPI
jgi:predicted MFS family arabinose efflux permease